MAKTRKPARPDNRTRFTFKIDAYTPATIPMARLAAYLTELATLLGEPASVHFERLIEGSTVNAFDVENEAVPKVRSRLALVADGDGPPEAMKAERALNTLLRDDNASGYLKVHRVRTPILKFPGKHERVEKPISVREYGTVQGELIRLGGRDNTIHATLKTGSQEVTGIRMSKEMAKQLGKEMFEFLRLHGDGKWTRDPEGNWTLEDFKLHSFEVLRRSTIKEALGELRRIGTGWEEVEDAHAQLIALRGRAGGADARH